MDKNKIKKSLKSISGYEKQKTSRLLEALLMGHSQKEQKEILNFSKKEFNMEFEKYPSAISFPENNAIAYSFSLDKSKKNNVGIPHHLLFSIDKVESDYLVLVPLKKQKLKKIQKYKKFLNADKVYVYFKSFYIEKKDETQLIIV